MIKAEVEFAIMAIKGLGRDVLALVNLIIDITKAAASHADA